MAIPSLTTEEFIIRAQKVHGDKYAYVSIKYVNAITKVAIICRTHGPFDQTPSSHLHGTGCPGCRFDGNRSSTEEFIGKARKVHGDTYDYSHTTYFRALQKVTICCPEHGPFEQRPAAHLNGAGCPTCCLITKRSSTEEFINKARNVHGDRYDYTQAHYVGVHQKLTIGCREHGSFTQLPNVHLRGNGCPICGGKQRSSTEEFINKARRVHGDTYDYTQAYYEKSQLKLTIICREHGPFTQLPNAHLGGNGCPTCGGKQRSSTEEFINKARNVHGDRYDYTQAHYVGVHQKLTIGCREHGHFKQRPNDHLKGNGCLSCVSNSYSKKCIRWLTQISNEQNINIRHAENSGEFIIPGTKWKADGYCVETNTIYEFHGDVYHGNPTLFESSTRCHPFKRTITAGELYQRTLAREEKIRSLGYNLVILWESEFRGSS